MKMNRLLISLLLIVAIVTLSSCAMFNKGTYSRTTTIGQELIDLKTARNNEAISNEEYNQLKKEIIANDPFKSKKIKDE